MKKISIAGGCYNEAENLEEFYQRCLAVLKRFPEYDYEFVVADNCSTDGSRDVLRAIALRDRKFKVIFNSNNFGHIRSPFHALLSTSGDAVISLCTDLQEPPELLPYSLRFFFTVRLKFHQEFHLGNLLASCKIASIILYLCKFYKAGKLMSAPDTLLLRIHTAGSVCDPFFPEA